ncbi:MAG: YheC/YheD family protein [Tumebacillaceae bacterium]
MGQGELDAERRYLNKWEMYKALHGEYIGACQLPETALFSASELRRLLEEYGSVFVKPVFSWGGQGISRVERSAGHYAWTLQGESPVTYATFDQLADAIVPVYEKSHCIVQQTAPLLRYLDCTFDVRVHMQRELDGRWAYAGEVVRVSGADSIVSNVAISGGYVLAVEQVVTEVLPSEAYGGDVDAWKCKLGTVGFAICHLLDRYHLFNEIGIDLGLDQNGGLWLIEVNTDDALGGPSHELFAGLPDQTVYRQIRQRYEQRNLGMFKLFMSWLYVDEEISNGQVDEKEQTE